MVRNVQHVLSRRDRLAGSVSVADLGASKQQKVVMSDVSPCVTASRAKARRLWLFRPCLTEACQLGVVQCGWLQGRTPSATQAFLARVDRRADLLEAFGNGMTRPGVRAIQRQLERVCPAVFDGDLH